MSKVTITKQTTVKNGEDYVEYVDGVLDFVSFRINDKIFNLDAKDLKLINEFVEKMHHHVYGVK